MLMFLGTGMHGSIIYIRGMNIYAENKAIIEADRKQLLLHDFP